MSENCENSTGIAVTDFKDGKGIIRLRCNQWSCESCAKVNQSRWRNHLLKTAVRLSDDWTLITITAPANAHYSMVTLKVIMKNFDRFSKRLQRHFGRFEYIRVYEQHKSKEFHCHVLCGVKIACTESEWEKKNDKVYYRGKAYKAVKKHAMESGLGYILDVRPLVDTSGNSLSSLYAIRYISKYLTKNVGAEMPKGTRRIQCSRKIGSPKVSSALVWSMKSGVYHDDICKENWYDMNQQGRQIETSDFNNSHIYPHQLDT